MTVSDREIDNYSDRDCKSVGNSQSKDDMPERWVLGSPVFGAVESWAFSRNLHIFLGFVMNQGRMVD